MANIVRQVFSSINVFEFSKFVQNIINGIERRNTARYKCNDAKCALLFKDEIYQVKMLDISCFGMRIDGVMLEQEATVFLKFPDLEQMSARVAWTNGENAGLEFVKPLCLDHPLIVHNTEQ